MLFEPSWLGHHGVRSLYRHSRLKARAGAAFTDLCQDRVGKEGSGKWQQFVHEGRLSCELVWDLRRCYRRCGRITIIGRDIFHVVCDCARMNLPNSITMSRVACVPILIWILSPAFPWTGGHGAVGLRGGEQEVIAAIVFILASITDGLDGYLARRRKQITTMGMLLDPLADKLMVSAAFIILVAYNPRVDRRHRGLHHPGQRDRQT
jgi:hypothetical protein